MDSFKQVLYQINCYLLISTPVVFLCLIPLGATAEKMIVGQNFWDLKWGAENTNPFKMDIENVTGDDPWKPEFIDECKPYHILRFMDWNKTNNCEREWARGNDYHKGGWAGRVQKSDPLQRPMAYEWQIDLCNKTMNHFWCCVPHVVDSAYQYELAKLIKEQLDPRLKVYIEWSNEVWHGAFDQYKYAAKKAREVGLPGDSDWTYAWAYCTYASVRLFENFNKVFGADSERVVRVIGGWQTTWTNTKVELSMLKHPIANPKNIKADAYAVAPYIDGLSGKNGLSDRIPTWTKQRETCDEYGLDYLFYEGGLNSGGSNVSDGYGKTKAWLAGVEKAGFKGGTHYCHGGGGAWACIPKLGVGKSAALKYGKYRALVEYADKVDKANNFVSIIQQQKRTAPFTVRSINNASQTQYVFDIMGRSVLAKNNETVQILVSKDIKKVPFFRFEK